MKLQQLVYFVAVAEEGSFSDAARRLRMAQPGLSVQIAQLEAELDTRLFIRHSRGITLSSTGKRVLQYAREILQLVDSVHRAIRDPHMEPHGLVSFGIPVTVSTFLPPPLLEEMQTRYPKITLNMVEVMTGYLIDLLETSRIDLALLYNFEETDRIATLPLFREDLYLVGAADQPMPAQPVDFAELSTFPLVVTTSLHRLRRKLNSLSAQKERPLNVRMEVDSLTQIRQQVENGVGYTVLPRTTLMPEWKTRSVAISDPDTTLDTVLAWLKGSDASYATECVIDTVRRLTERMIRSSAWPGARLYPPRDPPPSEP